MDMERTIAMLICLAVLSLVLACWIKIELNKKLSDSAAMARFMALFMFFPLWLLCVFALSEEAAQW